jgi:sorbose reductase
MFKCLMDVNLKSTCICAHAVGKSMLDNNNGGSMVFVASTSGPIVNRLQQDSSENTSTADVSILGKSLAAEWAEHKIRVNTVRAGHMDTALIRIPALDAPRKPFLEGPAMFRVGEVEELTHLAIFFASDASRCLTGSDIIPDGGYTTAW